ncbi:MAG: hypothetical protein GF313_01435 [Caldithrix sp.]|nr:hypothetical protein [Caldithrix sp.]
MKTFLCIGAHPDDIEFSCTATAYRLIQQGYKGRFVIMTNGENGFKADHVPREERVAIRKEEQMEVARLMGIDDVILLDYQDGFLQYTEELRRQITTIIKDHRPQIVFSFDPANQEFDDINLFHRDHRVAAQVVFDACFAAKNLWMYPGDSHRVSQLYFYGSNKPNHYEDITDLIDQKMEWLTCHKSQFPDVTKLERFIKDELSSGHPVYRYSEAFRVMPIRQIT